MSFMDGTKDELYSHFINTKRAIARAKYVCSGKSLAYGHMKKLGNETMLFKIKSAIKTTNNKKQAAKKQQLC